MVKYEMQIEAEVLLEFSNKNHKNNQINVFI